MAGLGNECKGLQTNCLVLGSIVLQHLLEGSATSLRGSKQVNKHLKHRAEVGRSWQKNHDLTCLKKSKEHNKEN